MKLGLKMIMCWMLAVAFGGAAASTIAAANASGMPYEIAAIQ